VSSVRQSGDGPRRVVKADMRLDWNAPPYDVILNGIGQQLKVDCELPRELPDRLLALLNQLEDERGG
jgi:hypothetical protein